MSGNSSVDLFKATAAFSLFLIAVGGGLLPERLEDVGSKIVSCLNTAAGGVFFASAMVHMLPESSETLNNAWGDVFPWGGFLCAFGFLLILCIDQAVSISNCNRNGKTGHTLVPTEPPPDGDHHSKSLLARGTHRSTDSDDLAELEMTGISPHALLAVSTMSGEETSGGGGGGSDRRTSHHQSHGRDRHNYDVIDGDGVNYRYQADNNSDTHDDAGSVVGRRARRESSHDDCHNGGTHSHGKGNGHGGHSHGLGSEGDGVWVRIALLLALSVHSIMEGLGVGAKSTKAFNLLFAIALHKGLAAYALGASLIQSGVRGRELSGFVLAFAVMTPAGILLGYLIEKDGEDDSAGAICVALAAGTFLYVSLMEVLPPELGSPKHGWAKMASLLAGFSVSAGVGWLVG